MGRRGGNAEKNDVVVSKCLEREVACGAREQRIAELRQVLREPDGGGRVRGHAVALGKLGFAVAIDERSQAGRLAEVGVLVDGEVADSQRPLRPVVEDRCREDQPGPLATVEEGAPESGRLDRRRRSSERVADGRAPCTDRHEEADDGSRRHARPAFQPGHGARGKG